MRLTDPDAVRRALSAAGVDGWLLYDFRGQNPTALELLGLRGAHLTRRFFYWIPAEGEPVHVVHAIEKGSFPPLPGRQAVYAGREALERELSKIIRGRRRVAMEYSPLGEIPYLSRVDAGTKEWVRTFGPEVVSSADLVQQFLCVWTKDQVEGHRRAALALDASKDEAFAYVSREVARGHTPTETEVQAVLQDQFRKRGLVSDAPPIVAVNAHAGDPHYAPHASRPTPVRAGDLLLVDLWAKLAPHERDDAAYADITWTAFVGAEPPAEIRRVFSIVAAARDASLSLVRAAHAAGRRIAGCEADRAAREVIAEAGFADRFLHRTGHNIGCHSAHGDGANLDDFETHDTRGLLTGTGFSIEPGIYLEQFGIRSEIDVYLGADGPQVFSPIQTEIVRLL